MTDELVMMSSKTIDWQEVIQGGPDRHVKQNGRTPRSGAVHGASDRAGGAPRRATGRYAPALSAAGRLSGRGLDAAIRTSAVVLVAPRYSDCGPTLAQEKLIEIVGRRRY